MLQTAILAGLRGLVVREINVWESNSQRVCFVYIEINTLYSNSTSKECMGIVHIQCCAIFE